MIGQCSLKSDKGPEKGEIQLGINIIIAIEQTRVEYTGERNTLPIQREFNWSTEIKGSQMCNIQQIKC